MKDCRFCGRMIPFYGSDTCKECLKKGKQIKILVWLTLVMGCVFFALNVKDSMELIFLAVIWGFVLAMVKKKYSKD